MKKIFLLLLFNLAVYAGTAQLPDGYYEPAYGKHGYALQVSLFHIISEHNTQSYGSLWEHFTHTDAKDDGTVWDIYSDLPGGTPPYVYHFISDQCGNYSGEGDCYNREHSMPKSWFNDASPMYTDLFHLYPTDGWVNSKRGNFPYGEVGNPEWVSQNGSKVGPNSFPGYGGTVFEPIDEFKGDLARSYFYMCTRYMDRDLDYGNGAAMLEGARFKPWSLSLLYSWHQMDSVSQKERSRNQAIYAIQGNRNPFIDYPELAGKIFGADSVTDFNPLSTGVFVEKQCAVYPNPVEDLLKIIPSPDPIISVELLSPQGRALDRFAPPRTGETLSINLSGRSPGIYFIQIITRKGREIHKIVKI